MRQPRLKSGKKIGIICALLFAGCADQKTPPASFAARNIFIETGSSAAFAAADQELSKRQFARVEDVESAQAILRVSVISIGQNPVARSARGDVPYPLTANVSLRLVQKDGKVLWSGSASGNGRDSADTVEYAVERAFKESHFPSRL